MKEILRIIVKGILYIPMKMKAHFDAYCFYENQYKVHTNIINAYEKRLKEIKLYAECNTYDQKGKFKNKIIELTTTPIEISSINSYKKP